MMDNAWWGFTTPWPRLQTARASRDFYAAVCMPVTALRTSGRQASWTWSWR